MRLDFPEGILVGIVVPGRKVRGILKLFDRSQLYIDESRIIKIGGDVILVDINCGDMCATGVKVNKPENHKKNHCPPPCSPPCTPRQQQPKCPPKAPCKNYGAEVDFSILSGGNGRIDAEDY